MEGTAVEAEEAVTINRPVEAVFDFLARPENHPRFVPGLLEFRTATDPMAAGADAVGTRRLFLTARRLPYRITQFERPRVLAMTTRIGPLEGGASYHLDSEPGSRTRVRFVVAGGFRGPLRIADWLLASTLTRDAKATCRNLKAVLEAEPPREP